MGRASETSLRAILLPKRAVMFKVSLAHFALVVCTLAMTVLLTGTEAAAAVPVSQAISSSTHPDENSWYSNDDPVLELAPPAAVVGSYGAAPRVDQVVLAGDYAYLAAGGAGLLIIDVSSPSAPALAGSYDTPDNANGVAVYGNYAYIADGIGGLQVINITNPATPTLAGSYDTADYIYSVTISGSYAYLIAYAQDGSSGVRIINVSDPAAPSLVGSIDTSGAPQQLVLGGSYAYVADWASGLQIINIANPSAPVIAGSIGTPYNALSVALSGSYAYVVDPGIGLRIINVSDPAAPSLAGSQNTAGWYYHIATDGGFAYLTDGAAGLLRIYDISNPTAPALVRSIDAGGLARGLDVDGDHLFAAAGADGLKIIDSNIWPACSYVFDQSPSTVPDTNPEGVVPTVAYADIADGVWYMHQRVADSQGTWGAATHRRAAIDTIPPSVTYTGPSGTIGAGTTVSGTYSESDSLSGIDAASAKVKLFSTNGFTDFTCTPSGGSLSCLVSGLGNFGHEATLSIADKAGNRASDAGSFTVSGAPDNLYRSYFGWYDNVGAADWVLMATPYGNDGNGSDLFFDLKIGGATRTLDPLPGLSAGQAQPGDTIFARYDGLMAGPVEVGYRSGDTVSSDPQAVASQRILWNGSSIEEVPAMEASRLSDHFYWTWYDQLSPGYSNWVMVTNPDTDPVYYELTIAGSDPGTGGSGTIAPGASAAPTFPGTMGGPVELRAWTDSSKTTTARVAASQRVLSGYGQAFNEQPGIPAADLASSYIWSWYDEQSAGARDWLLVANPGNAQVYYELTIAGADPGPGSSGTLQPGESATPHFPGLMGGPVRLQAWTDSDKSAPADVIASQRVIWGPSFDETPGFDLGQCVTTDRYHWTWYDQQSQGATNWVMVTNPGGSPIDYSIRIGEEVVDSGNIAAGSSISRTFPGRMGGPVQVDASGEVFASQRVLWNGYFNETPGTVLACGA